MLNSYFQVLIFLLISNPVYVDFTQHKMNKTKIRYVALGDSYTICEGAAIQEAWPTILTKHLNEKGVDIELVANPSVTGWTTQNLIDKELAIYDASDANFVTLLIGVNDWVQKVDKEKFHFNLNYIIDHIQKTLPDKSKIILITIPDFSATPNGPKYSHGRDITEGIKEFNQIISNEAKKRGLKVVDIFPTTQLMKGKDDLVSPDGLHPSAKEYALWEKVILPVAFDILK